MLCKPLIMYNILIHFSETKHSTFLTFYEVNQNPYVLVDMRMSSSQVKKIEVKISELKILNHSCLADAKTHGNILKIKQAEQTHLYK